MDKKNKGLKYYSAFVLTQQILGFLVFVQKNVSVLVCCVKKQRTDRKNFIHTNAALAINIFM